MGGNYQKDLFRQLTELMERVDTLESDRTTDKKELKRLNSDIASLQKENEHLRDDARRSREILETLTEENEHLRKENALLRDDNERMKRILNNDSNNSSKPPSTDEKGKPANTYNGRTKSGKKQGGQKGHKGKTLSKSEIEEILKTGKVEHRIKEIRDPAAGQDNRYVSRYRIDMEIKPVVTEYRIYMGSDGKYHIPEDLNAEAAYGDGIKAFCSYLYSEGVMSVERIAECLRSLLNGVVSLSTGSVYHFLSDFSKGCIAAAEKLEDDLRNEPVLCTDATVVTLNGKNTHIRNFSSENSVLYWHTEKKTIEALKQIPLLSSFAGILEHDHETALYHFGTGHAECNVHIGRYLEKNTEESGNTWSKDMKNFLNGMNRARNDLKVAGNDHFEEDAIARYRARYDAILVQADEQRRKTKGRYAKKAERSLIRRLRKYKENHLMFLTDFCVPYCNNMSERDLRKCKNRQKMSGGFRKETGVQMYCTIMSVVETAKRRKLNILKTIAAVANGSPVFG